MLSKTKTKVEICCKCYFVHRDDRTGIRQSKYHFHWDVERGILNNGAPTAVPNLAEEGVDDVNFVPTICVDCLGAVLRDASGAGARYDTSGLLYQWQVARAEYAGLVGIKEASCNASLRLQVILRHSTATFMPLVVRILEEMHASSTELQATDTKIMRKMEASK